MDQNFFTDLPSEITINILSRLPVRTIITCKCVCKSWLDLVETHEFAQSHLSKSVPGLAIYQTNYCSISASIKVFEIKDGLDLEHHELHCNLITKLDFFYITWIRGSVNGLLFVCIISPQPNVFYICNLITREYIEFRSPLEMIRVNPRLVTYGFGANKMTNQHKVVSIFHECIHDPETDALLRIANSECHVYTLGTGSWRRIAPGTPFDYERYTNGVFLTGNLHWSVSDLRGRRWISCFGLETELFSIFSPPPLPLSGHDRYAMDVFALGDCLCLCDNSSHDEIVIWLMKEYGVEKSWTKEFVIGTVLDFAELTYQVVRPIKVFEDGGDILMAWGDYCYFFYHSNKSKTTEEIDMVEVDYSAGPIDLILQAKLSFTQKFRNGERNLVLILCILECQSVMVFFVDLSFFFFCCCC